MKYMEQRINALYNKLPDWAKDLLKNVVANVIVYGIKQTPYVGPIFGILSGS